MKKTAQCLLAAILLTIICMSRANAAVDISSVTISGIKTNSVVIGWDSTVVGTSQIQYGPTISYGSITTEEPLSYFHITEISGLAEGTTYHFSIKAKDYTGAETSSADYSFTTLTPADMEAKVRAARQSNDLPKTYYVKTNGNDANNGLSLATAWQHPSHAAQFAEPGDTIYLVDDPDNPTDGIWYDERIIVYRSGIETHPITLKAYNGTPTFIATGANIREPNFHLVEFYDWDYPGPSAEPLCYWNIEGIRVENYTKSIFIFRGSHHINVTNVSFDNCYIGFYAGRGSHHIISKDLSMNNSWWNAWYVWNYTHHILAVNVNVTNQIEHSFFDIHSGDDYTGVGNDYISIINCSAEGSTISTTPGVYVGHGPNGTYDDYVSIINFSCHNVPLRYMFDIWSPGTNLYIDKVTSNNIKGMEVLGTGSNLMIRNTLVNVADSVSSHGVYFSSINNLDGVLLDNIRVEGVNKPYYYDFNFESGFDKIHNVTIRNPSGDNNNISIVVPTGTPANEYNLEFTDGRVFSATYDNSFPYYYPQKSNISINETGGNIITIYPMTVQPAVSSATVTINSFDTTSAMGSVLVDYTADTDNGNNVDFVIGDLKAVTNYLVKRDTANYHIVKSNANNCIKFSNSEWSQRNFTIQETNLPADIITPPDVIIGNNPPSSPQNLEAEAGNAQVSLSWLAPLAQGSSAITNYRIHRGNATGAETLLYTTENILSYTDNNVASGTTYYYQVSAVNANGESARSNEVSATPSTPISSKPNNTPYAYPVPYKAGKDAKLTFTNFTEPSKLEIYAIDGTLVYEKEVSGFSYSFVPEGFSSGVYLYMIKNSKGTSTGKIVIIK